jgi:hypothetical protein
MMPPSWVVAPAFQKPAGGQAADEGKAFQGAKRVLVWSTLNFAVA